MGLYIPLCLFGRSLYLLAVAFERTRQSLPRYREKYRWLLQFSCLYSLIIRAQLFLYFQIPKKSRIFYQCGINLKKFLSFMFDLCHLCVL